MSVHSLSPTLEDYLEAILDISAMNKVARSMEIADRLNVKRSSVTVALRSLARKGLINYKARSFITLTDKGYTTAKCIARRHHVLFEFFTDILGLSQIEADSTACSMEHGMSEEVCRKITALLNVLRENSTDTEKLRSTLEREAAGIDCTSDWGYEENERYRETTDLNSLLPGDKGTVTQVNGSESVRKRLFGMGIIRGQSVFVVRAAPFDDPIEVKVRNTHLSLRRDEAKMISVKMEM
ncbi:MAG: DtxR family transcriptional regulator [Chitinispirillaceae bacterium]